jgi:hypothetical protein
MTVSCLCLFAVQMRTPFNDAGACAHTYLYRVYAYACFSAMIQFAFVLWSGVATVCFYSEWPHWMYDVLAFVNLLAVEVFVCRTLPSVLNGVINVVGLVWLMVATFARLVTLYLSLIRLSTPPFDFGGAVLMGFVFITLRCQKRALGRYITARNLTRGLIQPLFTVRYVPRKNAPFSAAAA